MTATQLFSLAHGNAPPSGDRECSLCSGNCDGKTLVRSILSDSFTDWQHVHGDFLCPCCLLTLRSDERADQSRLYSWVLTESTARKLTKGDLAELRATCLNPPAPPYCIVLADSGQRHLLYRASVTHDAVIAGVDLEGERIEYSPADLAVRLELCRRIVAATAKGALAEFDPVQLAMSLQNYWGNWEPLFQQWQVVHCEPLSTLAAWLCPNREECQNEYPCTVPKRPRYAAAAAGRPDVAKVPTDHRGVGRPKPESGEPGLFG